MSSVMFERMCIGPGIPLIAVCDACGRREQLEPTMEGPEFERFKALRNSYLLRAAREDHEQLLKVAKFLERNAAIRDTLVQNMYRAFEACVFQSRKGESMAFELPTELWQLVPHEDNRTVLRHLHQKQYRDLNDVEYHIESLRKRIRDHEATLSVVLCNACDGVVRLVDEDH